MATTTSTPYQIVACRTDSCRHEGQEVKVVARMHEHLMEWPHFKCSGCGVEPTLIAGGITEVTESQDSVSAD